LRAVSVSSGRVLTSVTTTKTVYSVQAQNDVFRYVTTNELLEYESGFSRNEPEIFAVREAMELAVLSMIVEGTKAGEWNFASDEAGKAMVNLYDDRFIRARLEGNTKLGF
jgi:curli production assembly/transport component CsgG